MQVIYTIKRGNNRQQAVITPVKSPLINFLAP